MLLKRDDDLRSRTMRSFLSRNRRYLYRTRTIMIYGGAVRYSRALPYIFSCMTKEHYRIYTAQSMLLLLLLMMMMMTMLMLLKC